MWWNYRKRKRVFSSRDLSYSTQLIPLAAICTVLMDEKRINTTTAKNMVKQWYWCVVFGELYGLATIFLGEFLIGALSHRRRTAEMAGGLLLLIVGISWLMIGFAGAAKNDVAEKELTPHSQDFEYIGRLAQHSMRGR